MAPAYYNVASISRVTVITKGAALVLKFYTNPLPLSRSDEALGFAIGETLLNRFHRMAEFPCNYPEEKNYSVFIYRFVSEPSKIYVIALQRTAF